MSKILVTGGTGFIGSNLVRELVKEGHDVRVLDNLNRSGTESLKDLIDSDKVEFFKGDVRNKGDVDKAMEGVKYVFHLVAVCINYSIKFPKESIEINLLGSNNVFKSALEHNIKRIIFSSSASVYGDPKVLPMKEDAELNPVTPYCLAKLASEQLLKFYARSGLKYNILRYFNVYGSGQKPDAYYTSVISVFIKRIINKERPIIAGEGKQSMDFVNVKDIVQANILAMKNNVENEIFNVGTGVSTTIKDLAYILINSLDAQVVPEFDGRKVIVNERRADITKIQKMLGFKVTVDAKDGLAEFAKEIAENPERY
ncbi:SDR family NAD(P)-dependent oxidoreductase [Candidatus Woesearchaeota archaeon]|nr:SDR family NAD(P)-dependent oxidoreductase [Candidatus Woesearchaeota archaeon]